MSVGTRRLAAAQRTAVGRKPSRSKRLRAWIIIVPALSLFSFSIVAGAAGFKSKPDVAAAAATVVPQKHLEGNAGGSGGEAEKKQSSDGNKHDDESDSRDDGDLVLVDASHGDDGFAGMFGRHGQQVCWISKSQLTRVSAVYRTSTSTIHVVHTTYRLVTVYGANERGLRVLLGSSGVKCKLVHADRLFFLPFDPNMS